MPSDGEQAAVPSRPAAFPEESRRKRQAIAGTLLGTAVGDALGLPREGLSRRRARRLFGSPPLRHRFLLGFGMMSDDTEHACMTGQALLRGAGDPEIFASDLAWKLRFWLLGLPAGTGRATVRAVLKLWLGFSPERSGVWSAGNGPAMRAPILGVCLGHDRDLLRRHVRVSTRLTHTDLKAERGALLVAVAAHHAALHGPTLDRQAFLNDARAMPDPDDDLQRLLDHMADHLERDAPAVELADALGLVHGVSGYVYHTVPMALYCWLRHPASFREAVEEVIDLGGDADSTAAIVGALAGATLGADGIPRDWLNRLLEWPRSTRWMGKLAERLWMRKLPGRRGRPVALFWPGLIPRNIFFLSVVLLHGLRRLLPPY